MGFPDFLRDDLVEWIQNVMELNRLTSAPSDLYRTSGYLDAKFRRFLQREFMRNFPDDWPHFIREVVADEELLADYLSLLLRNFANGSQAKVLESLLRHVNSEFTVKATKNDAEDYDVGCFDLEYRVPRAVRTNANNALNSQLLLDAWHACYGTRSPDYEKCVSACADFLEGYLRDKFYPEMERTKTIPQFINDFKEPEKIGFVGDGFVKDRMSLVSLLTGLSNARGQHTTGKGRPPTPEDAKYVLHTTIYIWNLMEGKSSRGGTSKPEE